jgi:hypothetical protein
MTNLHIEDALNDAELAEVHRKVRGLGKGAEEAGDGLDGGSIAAEVP